MSVTAATNAYLCPYVHSHTRYSQAPYSVILLLQWKNTTSIIPQPVRSLSTPCSDPFLFLFFTSLHWFPDFYDTVPRFLR